MPSQYYRTEHPYGSPPEKGNAQFAKLLGVPPAPKQDPPMLAYRAASLEHSFDLRARLRCSRVDDKPMVGIFMGALICPAAARMVGQVGVEWVMLDWASIKNIPFLRPIPAGISELQDFIKWIQLSGEGKTAVVVRVPNSDENWIAWALDAGASGLIVPHVESVEQAKKVVSYARHPPNGGVRSWAPFGFISGLNDAPNAFEVSGGAAIILQIESQKGVDNVDEIAKTEGIDGLMFGPGDYALDINVDFLKARENAQWVAGRDKICAAAKRHDLALLYGGSSAGNIPTYMECGVTMIICAFDMTSLYTSFRKSAAETWKDVAAWRGKGTQKEKSAEQ